MKKPIMGLKMRFTHIVAICLNTAAFIILTGLVNPADVMEDLKLLILKIL